MTSLITRKTLSQDRYSTSQMVRMFMKAPLLNTEVVKSLASIFSPYFRETVQLQVERRFSRPHLRIASLFTSLIMELRDLSLFLVVNISMLLIWWILLSRCIRTRSTQKCWSTLKLAKVDPCLKTSSQMSIMSMRQQLLILRRAHGLPTAHLKTKSKGSLLEVA